MYAAPSDCRCVLQVAVLRAEEGRKRVELVQKSALRRMRWQAILRGWGAWREVCESKRRQEQLLAAAGSRLRRPALVCVWTHWRRDWEQAEWTKVLECVSWTQTPHRLS